MKKEKKKNRQKTTPAELSQTRRSASSGGKAYFRRVLKKEWAGLSAGRLREGHVWGHATASPAGLLRERGIPDPRRGDHRPEEVLQKGRRDPGWVWSNSAILYLGKRGLGKNVFIRATGVEKLV